MSGDRRRSIGARVEFAAAEVLERDDPELVARTANELRAAAEGDLRHRVPRSVAYVRRLQALTVERPELGIAAAKALDLDHIVEDLLEGISVDGVPGIGADGAALSLSRRHILRLRGKWILGISATILLFEAVLAVGVPSWLVYLWTTVGLGLFFVGSYLVFMLHE